MQFTEEHENRLPPSMPVLLRILALLHLIGGGYLLVTIVQAVAGGVDLNAPAEMIDTSPVMILLGVVFLGVLGLSAGVGMYVGKPWGWWVAAFYEIYAILRAGNAMLFTIGFWDELTAEGSSRGPEYHLLKFGGRVVIHAFILAYLFRRHVIEYFGLSEMSRWRALAKLIGIEAVLYLIIISVSLLS